ncbi:MAG: hypothetical protein ACRD8A_12800, partial [Candidatus Acidiferrales bacterium]
KINKSERYVYQRIQLAKLTPEAQKAFLEDKLSASHATLICRLQPRQQKKALKQSEHGGSVRDLADWIGWNVHLDLREKAAFPLDDTGAVKSSALLPGVPACEQCPKRTGSNTQLFADVKNGDTCTDPQCFHEKESAYVKIQVGTHPEAKMLSADMHSERARGLTNWRPAGKESCKHTVEGVVVEQGKYGTREVRLGQVLKVCTSETCATHRPKSRGPARYHTPAPTKTEKAGREKEKLENEVRDSVEQQIVEKIWAKAEKVGTVPRQALALLVEQRALSWWGDAITTMPLRLAFGKTVPVKLRAAILKLKPAKVAALVVTVAAAGALQDGGLSLEGTSELCRWAGIDGKKMLADAIKAKAKAEAAAKPKASAKPAKKAKVGKKAKTGKTKRG